MWGSFARDSFRSRLLPPRQLLAGCTLIFASLLGSQAQAHCWAGGDPDVRRLQEQIDRNPTSARIAVERAIDSERRAQGVSEKLGWLLAAYAADLTLLSEYPKALEALGEAQRLPNKTKSLEIELGMRSVLLVGTKSGAEDIKAEIRKLEALKGASGTLSRQSICASLAIAYHYRSLGDDEQALRFAGDAYRNAKKAGHADVAAFVANTLSFILNRTGDVTESDSLAAEGEKWARKNGYTTMLLFSVYQRAQMAKKVDPSKAAEKFKEVAKLSRQLGMTEADGTLGACDSLLLADRPTEALPFCQHAERFSDPGAVVKGYVARQLLAEALLRSGRNTEAAVKLDSLLAENTPPAVGARVDRARELRARAYFEAGDFRSAYSMLEAAYKSSAERQASTREEEIAKLRTQFAWDRQRIANAELKAELAQTAANAQIRQNWLITAVGWSILLVLVFAWAVFSFRRNQRRLEALANEARDIARSKAELLSTMSHEIRSPLGSLTLAASNIARSSSVSDDNRERAQQLSFAADRLLRQLEDLLLFSRLDARQLNLAIHTYRPRELVNRAVSLVSDQSQAIGVTIQVAESDRAPGSVQGDQGRVGQIVSNLLENAIRHSGGDLIVVSIGEADADRFFVEVEDNGRGLTAIEREQALERFAQPGQGRITSGSGFGLGLSICNSLAELMGGEMELGVSELGGLSVRVELPISFSDARTSAEVIREVLS